MSFNAFKKCPSKAKNLLNKFSIFLSLFRIFLRGENLHFKACQKQLLLEIESKRNHFLKAKSEKHQI